MRSFLLVALALLLTGCATLQRPEVEPMPATLAEVNQALDGRKAMVYFDAPRESERGYVTVGPTEAVIQTRELNGRAAEVRQSETIVATAEIVRIEADASLSTGQGAIRGGLLGAAPVAFAALTGEWQRQASPDHDGPGFVLGAVLVVPSFAIGAGTGALVTSSRDWVTVYQAPVTRYPDAALALLEAEANPTVASR